MNNAQKDELGQMLQYLEKDLGKVLKTYEEKYECAGICTPGLFSISRSIDKGQAQQDCVTGVVDDIADSSKPVGMFGLVLGIILLLTAICTIPLCGCCRAKQE